MIQIRLWIAPAVASNRDSIEPLPFGFAVTGWLLKPFAVIMTLLLIGCASAPIATRINDSKGAETQTSASGPLLERALHIPAADLASSYFTVKVRIDMLQFAEQGAVVKTPERSIDKNNVKDVKAELEDRLSTYETAINQRGYKFIAGTYFSNASASCANVPSLWVRGMLMGELSTLNITQHGFIANIAQQAKHKSSTLKMPAIIVESSLALADPGNSDFRFRGEVTGDEITLRPDVDEILATWPSWMRPPSRADLSSCRILFAPGQSIVPFSR